MEAIAVCEYTAFNIIMDDDAPNRVSVSVSVCVCVMHFVWISWDLCRWCVTLCKTMLHLAIT